MGPIELARWQWEDYRLAHASRRNLLIHLVAVPLFVFGNLVFVAGLAFLTWLWVDLRQDLWQDIAYVLGVLGAAIGGLAVSAGAIAWQGTGHKHEQIPPKPFASFGNAIGRIFLEQWFTYWRFLASGGGWSAWKGR